MNRTTSINRIKAVLASGTLIGLILATTVVLGLRDVSRSTVATPTVQTQTIPENSDNRITDLQNQVDALQSYNQQLEQALRTQQQQVVVQPSANSASGQTQYEENEHEEHEHEEHEHEEHEHEEYDD